jgi:hypothetical protein
MSTRRRRRQGSFGQSNHASSGAVMSGALITPTATLHVVTAMMTAARQVIMGYPTTYLGLIVE